MKSAKLFRYIKEMRRVLDSLCLFIFYRWLVLTVGMAQLVSKTQEFHLPGSLDIRQVSGTLPSLPDFMIATEVMIKTIYVQNVKVIPKVAQVTVSQTIYRYKGSAVSTTVIVQVPTGTTTAYYFVKQIEMATVKTCAGCTIIVTEVIREYR